MSTAPAIATIKPPPAYSTTFEWPRFQGGYKEFRNWCLSKLNQFNLETSYILVGGATGSAKSFLIRESQNPKGRFAALDLEGFANHRGSAFGSLPGGQPAQAQFENQMLWSWLEVCQSGRSSWLALEDESRLIGRCVIPDHLFLKMRSSPVVVVEESLSSRIQWILKEYVRDVPREKRPELFLRYQDNIRKIQRKLGGARAQELLQDLKTCQAAALESEDLSINEIWIRKLLEWYYDPLYSSSFEKRAPRVEYKGSRAEVLEYLREKCRFL